MDQRFRRGIAAKNAVDEVARLGLFAAQHALERRRRRPRRPILVGDELVAELLDRAQQLTERRLERVRARLQAREVLARAASRELRERLCGEVLVALLAQLDGQLANDLAVPRLVVRLVDDHDARVARELGQALGDGSLIAVRGGPGRARCRLHHLVRQLGMQVVTAHGVQSLLILLSRLSSQVRNGRCRYSVEEPLRRARSRARRLPERSARDRAGDGKSNEVSRAQHRIHRRLRCRRL
jgi:hypothetical protein